MTDHLLTATAVARLLSVTPAWVNRAASASELPAYRVAGGRRFDVNELGLWLTLRGNAAVEQPDNPRRRILPPPRPRRVNPAPEPIVDLQGAIPAEEVAHQLEVPLEAVRRWIREAILPGARAGRSWLVDAEALKEWQLILSRAPHLDALPAGRLRTGAIRDAVLQNLLGRMGIHLTVGSWQRHGGVLPTWAEAVIDPRRHRQPQ
ncbi:helix-turn-helix domain-containing protein [Cellulosimicrobium cellulans]|uniref:helix-turn-helix domain-containing protein n=1 Tax=Cellulosimicrobium cellulans TaxID=1710 RepID=UPI00165223A6|nr:helix-turn-helix domain-containing protein [Cellulosimicrobium cellulans]